jgi:hypothetical protein
MKNKIVGIFVCMILIVTAIHAVEIGTLANRIEVQKIPTSDGVGEDIFGKVSISGNSSLIRHNSIHYLSGWPQETAGPIDSSPVVADLDNDGEKEIIVGSGTADGPFNVYVFRSNGSLMDGWPISVSGGMWTSPAVGDIDDDGTLEIVMGVDSTPSVYIWHPNGTIYPGWPKNAGWVTASPTLADLDDDGDLEIIVGSTISVGFYNTAIVNIWHHDGTNVPGWPIRIQDYTHSYVEYSSAGVADIDNDGALEITMGIRTVLFPQDDWRSYLYVWHANGTLVDGWPVSPGRLGYIYSSPAIGDIDNDNDLEIITGSDNYLVNAWHHNGTYVRGWPKYIPLSWVRSQALGDVNGDGTIEIVSGSVGANAIYVWNGNGTLLQGWPQTTNGFIYSSPILGDIDGDRDIEIIASSFDHNVYAWHHDGTMVSSFPLETNGEIFSTPCVSDIDSDGYCELIVGSRDKNLYIWQLEGTYDEQVMEWPMFQHDRYHLGYYNHLPNTPTISGKTNGSIRTSYDYTIQTTDFDEDDMKYFIDWGDNNNSGWIGPYRIGQIASVNHSWDSKGTYAIKVKAKDQHGLESDWATLTVTMPYSFNRPILQFLELLFQRFPNAFPILRHLLGY